MHVSVKDLPRALRDALASVGYGRADISVEARDTYSMSTGGSSQGRRAFVVAVDLATGQKKMAHGSWGGPNMFNPNNAVDLDSEDRPLPPNFAVIHGSEGDSVYARVQVNPATLAPMLPARAELTEAEHAVLSMYAGLTSAGRKDQIERWARDSYWAAGLDPFDKERYKQGKAAHAALYARVAKITDALVERKLLARNKAGAISVTTAGKNAASADGKMWSQRIPSEFPEE